MDALEETVSKAIATGETVARVAAVVMILLTVRLFRYFRLQPELAIISNTIIRAFPDICNLILILMVMNLGFAQCAVFAWGTDLDEFKSLSKAFMTMFLIGEFGEFYVQMKAVNEPLTNFFMILYVLLCTVVAMNIFLAIVCDAYEDVKEEHGDYATDDTPSIMMGSVEQLMNTTRWGVNFVARCAHTEICHKSEAEHLTWHEQMQLENYSWADLSRAITKIDKSLDKRPGTDDPVTANDLAAALKPTTTVPVARVLLQQYVNANTKAAPNFLDLFWGCSKDGVVGKHLPDYCRLNQSIVSSK
jgi:hypothetical protein